LPANHPVSHYHRNQQYSIIALTNGSGIITERYAYNAYGTPTITDASGTVLISPADNNRYTYTGREWDLSLSLYHYRARMYDAVAGRFCSRDPIGYLGGISLFCFVQSRPLVFLDPLGLEITTAVATGGYFTYTGSVATGASGFVTTSAGTMGAAGTTLTSGAGTMSTVLTTTATTGGGGGTGAGILTSAGPLGVAIAVGIGIGIDYVTGPYIDPYAIDLAYDICSSNRPPLRDPIRTPDERWPDRPKPPPIDPQPRIPPPPLDTDKNCDDRDECDEHLLHCLTNQWSKCDGQYKRKDCVTCYGYCTANGAWPTHICPE
jgi:RHS repeat-associated protein